MTKYAGSSSTLSSMISEIIAEFAQDSWIYRVTFFVCVNVGLTNNLIDDLFPIEFCLTILLYSIIFFIKELKPVLGRCLLNMLTSIDPDCRFLFSSSDVSQFISTFT